VGHIALLAGGGGCFLNEIRPLSVKSTRYCIHGGVYPDEVPRRDLVTGVKGVCEQVCIETRTGGVLVQYLPVSYTDQDGSFGGVCRLLYRAACMCTQLFSLSSCDSLLGTAGGREDFW